MLHQRSPLPVEVFVEPRVRGENRRAEPRFHCGPATLAQLVPREERKVWRGWVLDLSSHGAGVLLPHPLEDHTDFILHIKSTDGDRRYELTCRVVHATCQPLGDWLIGCEFESHLSSEDLDALL